MDFQSINASASPEVQMNENFDTINYTSVYGKRQPVSTGLTWGYYGGRWNGIAITQGTLSLTNTATNYIVVQRSTGTISVSTATTNWDNTADYARVYKVVTAGGVVSGTPEDHRAALYGVFGESTPNTFQQNSQSANYTTVLLDAGRHILHPVADNNPRTFTLAANSAVPYPIGTTIMFVNEINILTVAINTDTLILAGVGSTGSQKVGPYGYVTALKIGATKWMIDGTGIVSALLVISVADTTTVTESITVIPGTWSRTVFDSTTVTESVTVIQGNWNRDVSDTTTVTESVTVILGNWNIDVFDSTTVTEDVIVTLV